MNLDTTFFFIDKYKCTCNLVNLRKWIKVVIDINSSWPVSRQFLIYLFYSQSSLHVRLGLPTSRIGPRIHIFPNEVTHFLRLLIHCHFKPSMFTLLLVQWKLLPNSKIFHSQGSWATVLMKSSNALWIISPRLASFRLLVRKLQHSPCKRLWALFKCFNSRKW